MEQITQVTSSLSLEGRGQPRAKVGGIRFSVRSRSFLIHSPYAIYPIPSPPLKELVMEEDHSMRRAPRLAKRARAVVDQVSMHHAGGLALYSVYLGDVCSAVGLSMLSLGQFRVQAWCVCVGL